jgi:predicted ArsR family transcriptional regulator
MSNANTLHPTVRLVNQALSSKSNKYLYLTIDISSLAKDLSLTETQVRHSLEVMNAQGLIGLAKKGRGKSPEVKI